MKDKLSRSPSPESGETNVDYVPRAISPNEQFQYISSGSSDKTRVASFEYFSSQTDGEGSQRLVVNYSVKGRSRLSRKHINGFVGLSEPDGSGRPITFGLLIVHDGHARDDWRYDGVRVTRDSNRNVVGREIAAISPLDNNKYYFKEADIIDWNVTEDSI
jgi:hypothetical protein